VRSLSPSSHDHHQVFLSEHDEAIVVVSQHGVGDSGVMQRQDFL